MRDRELAIGNWEHSKVRSYCSRILKLVPSSLLLVPLIAGCAKPAPDMALYGNWDGAFVPDKPGHELKGYVQLYATGHRFKMHIGTDRQSFDPSGTWELKGRQILLNIVDLQSTGITSVEAKMRGVHYINPADIRSAYGQTLVLNLAPDWKSLEGLPMTIAGTSGHHAFKKLELSHYN